MLYAIILSSSFFLFVVCCFVLLSCFVSISVPLCLPLSLPVGDVVARDRERAWTRAAYPGSGRSAVNASASRQGASGPRCALLLCFSFFFVCCVLFFIVGRTVGSGSVAVGSRYRSSPRHMILDTCGSSPRDATRPSAAPFVCAPPTGCRMCPVAPVTAAKRGAGRLLGPLNLPLSEEVWTWRSC
jgi:hypothetical protein